MTLAGKWEAAMHLFRTYVTALPRLAYRSTFSLVLDPRGAQKFLHQVLSAQDLEEDCPVLGSAAIADLLPGEADPQIRGSHHVQQSSDTRILLELIDPGVSDAGASA